MRNELPKDPYMLLSVVNTALRDEFESLEDMCRAMDFDEDSIVETLKSVGYEYNKKMNCFK